MRPDQPPNDHVRDANQRVLWQTGLGVAMLGIVLAAVWPSPRSGGFEATLFGLAMGSILLIGMSLSMRKRKPKSRHCPGFIVALVNSKGTVVNGQPVPVDWAVWDSTTHLYKIGSRWYDPQFGVRVKPLVTKVERVDVTLNRTYQAFAAHYGVAIVPARPRKPRDKGQKGLSMPARPYSISTTGRSRRCGSWAISTVSYDNYTAINAVPEAGGVERVQKLPGERGGDPIYA